MLNRIARCSTVMALAVSGPLWFGSAPAVAEDGKIDIPMQGYADVSAFYRDPLPGQSEVNDGFAVGSLDFFMTPSIGENVRTLIEIIAEYDGAGDLMVDLERLQLGYLVNDDLTVWTGRFHTPYGYWNTGFHHGLQLQTAASRPVFLDFEDAGGIMPAHSVGAWITGKHKYGKNRMTYDVYLANGPAMIGGTTGERELAPNNAKDNNRNKLAGFNLGYGLGGSMDGLKLGLHGFRSDVGNGDGTAPATIKTEMTMLGGYAYYDNHDVEAIAEYYNFSDKAVAGGTTSDSLNSWAGFAQVGYYVAHNIIPYLRTEKTKLNQDDQYFSELASGRSYAKQVLGVRYDLDMQSALKLELSHTDQTDPQTAGGTDKGKYDEIRMQFAVRF